MRLKQSVRPLGLSLIAFLSMLALTASGAQANDGSAFFSGNPHVILGAGSSILVDSESLEAGELLVPALAIELNCSEAEAHGKLEAGGKVSALALFLGCTILGAEEDCVILPSLGSGSSGVIHATANGLLRKKNGKHYLLAEGLGAGKTFAAIVIEGEFCPLDNTHTTINGSIVFELPDALSLFAHHRFVPLLHAQALALGFTDNLLFFGSAEIHDGEALVLRSGSSTVWGIL
jgi:hypothetical protein